MNLKGNNIPSMSTDDELLSMAVQNVCNDIKDKYICSLPSTWYIECGIKKITYSEIKSMLIEQGISVEKANNYYGQESSIITDSYIIWLIMNDNGKQIKKPLFIGEMKKQGTNDKRVLEGKKRQAIGNAGPDRVAKNFFIASEYCYLLDKDVFPYNVFLHGCDFNENEITKTTKSKLEPFFGNLNILNPFFDKDIPWSRKGGSCFYQGTDYTHEELYNYSYKCCEITINYYLKKYNIFIQK
jgi:type II restriction enzyme